MRLTTDSMELVSLVVFKSRAEEVASYLLHAGFFHPVDIRDVERGLGPLSLAQVSQDFDRFDRLQAKTSSLARQLGITLKASTEIRGLSFEGSEAALKRIEEGLTGLLVKKEELREAVKADETVLTKVIAGLPFAIPQEGAYSLLFVSRGSIEEKNLPVLERGLEQVPHVIYPFGRERTRIKALVIGVRRDRETLRGVLADAGWQEEAQAGPGLSEEEQAWIRTRIAERKEEAARIDAAIEEFKGANSKELSSIYSFCALNKSLAEARRYAVLTDRTVIFSGWVPAQEKQRLLSGVAAFAEAYIEAKRPEDTGVAREDVPVRFGRHPFLAPFTMLVESYGVPRYGTLDPTVFVAMSFIFMFGLMFGDLGQGLVFALLGLLLLKNRNAGLRQSATMFLYCGLSSAVFGFLEGSVFGFEFPSLWEKPMEDVMGILRFAIFGGIAIISAGIVLNVVNALRDRDYLKAFFDRAGVVGGFVYWSAIVVITRVMFERRPAPSVLYAVIAAGLGLLFLFPMVEYFLHKRHKKEGSFFESFMESLLGLLEFGMNYLANSVSFVRMGAFALAHAALFLAVFQIAKMSHGAASAGTIIAGNIAIMVLEGVVVSIQSLRLNYYEFFSKFFVAGKTAFTPLSVRYG